MDAVANPRARFLLQLIISDEEKHRATIHAMVATLKGILTSTKPEGSLGAGGPATINGRVCAATEQLLELEKAGIREYKVLIKQSRDDYQGMFRVLLDTMIRDSEKHMELLEFLKDTAK